MGGEQNSCYVPKDESLPSSNPEMLIYCSFADREPSFASQPEFQGSASSFPLPAPAWLSINHCGSVSKCTQEWELCLRVALRRLQFNEITLPRRLLFTRESGLFVTTQLPLLFDKLKHLLLIIRECHIHCSGKRASAGLLF